MEFLLQLMMEMFQTSDNDSKAVVEELELLSTEEEEEEEATENIFGMMHFH